MFPPFLLISIFILAGLVFVLFVGHSRRNARGQKVPRAPFSPETPIIGDPQSRSRGSSSRPKR